MAATVAIQAVLTWLQRYYLLRLETKLALGTSSRFFNHILRLPAAYFGQRFAGEIGSRVAINDNVAKIIGGRARDDRHRQRPDDLLRGADVPLRRPADARGARCCRPAQHRRGQGSPAALRTDASRRLLQDQGKLHGHGDERSADDRDPQGDRRRGASSSRAGPATTPSRSTPTQHLQRARPDRRRGAAVRADRCRPRRCCVLGGLKVMNGELHRRHARRLPDAARQLHAPARQLRATSARRCRSSRPT